MRFLFLIFFCFFFFIFYEGLKKDPSKIPSNLISKNIPEFKLKSFDNAFMTNDDLYENEIKIINFFASWCPPCQVEHKQLIHLSNKYSVFGIAKKNKLKDLSSWLKKLGNPYKKIGMDLEGIVSIDWGVYGLPETFIVDAKGIIKYRHVGPIMKRDLKEIETVISNLR
tara:strand:- start:207 stop:710 length:504 start_codon:yes stop_codon:yes gene_type:complete